ncbi:beta-lactamase family protein [Muricauda oceani]|uniref:Beta-lactamase family protein n=1 Tax=Flagellimonas oceani TaxID=2698672 RepID=A0A6G7IX75_9FLAO|nr:serine hydrolase domain-containing protein [Allomuricauda oceani]MBW8244442.1 beta-lactamase family protein [Allomuricauda oceani]QII43156.1 beta-lactamase family protein [Allomuricauda oceani]
MKHILGIFGVLLFAACGQNSGQKKMSISPKLESVRDSVDTYFTKLTELERFNGVLLVYKNDTLLLDKAYNLNRDSSSSTYVTTDFQFDIHSISKLMTHYLMAQLELDGKLSMDQTLDAYFDDFPRGSEITLSMLLEHKSGLPRELMGFEGEEYQLTSDEILELSKEQALLFRPGTDVQYSNVGYEILYYIIASMYGKSFSQCVVDEIFGPLGMDSSGVHFFVKENRVKNMAQNHVLKDGKITPVDNIQKDEFRNARLFSTADDLKKFMDHIKQEPYASILKDKNGVLAKDGGSKGIRAQVYSDLHNHFDFVLLANYDEIPFFEAIDDMVKLLNSEKVDYPKEINRKAIAIDEGVLQKYAGAYTFADFDGLVLEVRVENGHLALFQKGEKIGELQAESPTVFFEDPKAAESFEFVKNESGTYDALMGWKGIVVAGKRN